MKYVAFLDILGFKSKLKSLSQSSAKQFIADFSATVYSVFRETDENIVKGYIVSDSVILHTADAREKSLLALLEIVEKICREEFSEHGILIRGAVAKGEFDKVPAIELPQLQKQLIVGQAYVDAYLLENSLKTLGINLSKEVYDDLMQIGADFNVIEEKINGNAHFVFRYVTIDFLLDEENLRQFVRLAKAANWLPHYYNTIYFALKRENNEKKVEQVFINIQNLVCENNPSENWRDIDAFIEKSFDGDVISEYKKRFLKHIRINLF